MRGAVVSNRTYSCADPAFVASFVAALVQGTLFRSQCPGAAATPPGSAAYWTVAPVTPLPQTSPHHTAGSAIANSAVGAVSVCVGCASNTSAQAINASNSRDATCWGARQGSLAVHFNPCQLGACINVQRSTAMSFGLSFQVSG